MAFHRFIKTKGERANVIGYYAPRLYRLDLGSTALKIFGFSYLKDRLSGWYYWWVDSEENFVNATRALDELMKTNMFTYKYTE